MTAGRLERLLRPRSLVFVGGEAAELAIEASRSFGFEGEMWAVNPRRSLGGIPTFRSVSELPDTADTAFVGVGHQIAVEVVRALASVGTGAAVCHASGFAETGAAGTALQHDLSAAAAGMPLVGPNCYGTLCALNGAALWPDVHGLSRCERGVALISQSGNIAVNLTMQRRGLDIAWTMALGNQADVGIAEAFETLAADRAVTGIGLCIEAVDDVQRFTAAADSALRRRLPVVALKLGAAKASEAIAVTHTASLVGDDAAYDALFRRLGIRRVGSVPELLDTLAVMSALGPLRGNRLISLSCSGGEAALVADSSQVRDLHFPPLAPAHTERVATALDGRVAVTNPLDYHTFIWGDQERLEACFRAALGAAVTSAQSTSPPTPPIDISPGIHHEPSIDDPHDQQLTLQPDVLAVPTPKLTDPDDRQLTKQRHIPDGDIPDGNPPKPTQPHNQQLTKQRHIPDGNPPKPTQPHNQQLTKQRHIPDGNPPRHTEPHNQQLTKQRDIPDGNPPRHTEPHDRPQTKQPNDPSPPGDPAPTHPHHPPFDAAMLVLDFPAEGLDRSRWWPTLQAFAAACAASHTPGVVAASMSENFPSEARSRATDMGLASCGDLDNTLAALEACSAWGRHIANLWTGSTKPTTLEARPTQQHHNTTPETESNKPKPPAARPTQQHHNTTPETESNKPKPPAARPTQQHHNTTPETESNKPKPPAARPTQQHHNTTPETESNKPKPPAARPTQQHHNTTPETESNKSELLEARSAQQLHPADSRISVLMPPTSGRDLTAGRAVTEHDAKQRLGAAGIAIPDGMVVPASAAVNAAEQIGYPVVLKITDALHKSDVGGVAVGLVSAAEVSAAAETLATTGDELVLVEEFVGDAVAELLVGVRSAPPVGMLLTLGAGGTLAELLDDTISLLVGVTPQEVHEALRSLRTWPLLAGHRGRHPGAVESAVEAICALDSLVRDDYRMVEVEINPLIVTSHGAVAADALMLVCDQIPVVKGNSSP